MRRRAVAQDNGAGGDGAVPFAGAGQTGGAWTGWGAGVLGTLAHPARPRARPDRIAGIACRPSTPTSDWMEPTVAWLALEIVLGLAAFILIIWWTLPRRKRDDKAPPEG